MRDVRATRPVHDLDGFDAGDKAPAYLGYFGPDFERWIGNELEQPQVILMGRVTYEAMAEILGSGAFEDANQMTEVLKLVS